MGNCSIFLLLVLPLMVSAFAAGGVDQRKSRTRIATEAEEAILATLFAEGEDVLELASPLLLVPRPPPPPTPPPFPPPPLASPPGLGDMTADGLLDTTSTIGRGGSLLDIHSTEILLPPPSREKNIHLLGSDIFLSYFGTFLIGKTAVVVPPLFLSLSACSTTFTPPQPHVRGEQKQLFFSLSLLPTAWATRHAHSPHSSFAEN